MNIQPPSDYKTDSPEYIYGRPWGKREFIIVFDCYVKFKSVTRSLTSPFIIDTSKILGRTPSSVLMRIENFSSIEGALGGRKIGLNKVGKDCKSIFDEWSTDPSGLAKCAQVLRELLENKNDPTIFDFAPVIIPKTLGGYELLDRIGVGGYGEIYSCISNTTNILRAIKIIKADLIHSDEVRHRFYREIRAIKSMTHPNIIKIYEDNLDLERKFPAFIMEYADGNLEDFRENINITPNHRNIFPRDEAINIYRSMLDAVKYLHSGEHKIIHRDINPCNILKVPEGRWVLADFGLSKFIGKLLSSNTFNTSTNAGAGTHYYAAPEQWRNLSSCDERTDIYSLGILLWDLFTKFFPPHDRSDSGLETRINLVHLAATEKEPCNRYQSVEELTCAFEDAIK